MKATDGLPLFEQPIPENPYAGTTPRVRSSDTSQDAGDSMMPAVGTLRRQVYNLIAVRPSTDDEVEDILGLRHQTASARRRELVLLGLVKDSGERRFTSSGRKATVWRVV